MNVTTFSPSCYTVTQSDRDDLTVGPVSVIIQDLAPGRGIVIVECEGNAWSAFFGSTGESHLIRFLTQCDSDYLAQKLCPTVYGKPKKPVMVYLRRVVQVAISGLKLHIEFDVELQKAFRSLTNQK